MMMRQDFSAGVAAASDPNCCRNCGVKERPLHEVCCQRGNFRRVCTSCVLRLHPQSFCPTCFSVYNPSQPHSSPNDVVTCFKCYSASHSQCVGPTHPTPYVCPICVCPNSPIFAPKRAKDANVNVSLNVNDDNCRVIDKKAARVFLAAARIAAISTSKATLAARSEAEDRAKEAAETRKHARAALEHLSYLVAKEKMRKELSVAPPEISRPGGLVNSIENKGWNMSTAMIAASIQHDDRNKFGNLNRVETSTEVLAALNLKERERLQEIKVRNPVAGFSAIKNSNMMDVEENGGIASGLVNMGSGIQNHADTIMINKSGDVDSIENCNGQGLRINKGTVPIPSVEDRNPQIQHIRAGEKINSAMKE